MKTLGTNRAYWLGSGLAAFGQNLFGASQIAIDPHNPNFVTIAGKGGFWATQNGGQMWYPAGNGAGGSEVSNIKISGNTVTTNDVDWTGITTTNGFSSYTIDNTPGAFAKAALSRSVNGHTYSVNVSGDDITMDGKSIADDYAKAAIANANDLQIASDGTVYVALYGGGVLKGAIGGSPPPPTQTIPSNTTAPSISGTAQVGQKLTLTQGTWTGTPTPTLSEQWQRNTGSGFQTIAGQSGTSYTLTSADQGATIQVVETATSSAGTTAATSNVTGTVLGSGSTQTAPTNATAPSISGTAQVGQTLTVKKGTWNGSPAPSVTELWQRNAGSGFQPIAGQTGTSYTLTSTDQGATIRVIETASNTAGSATATSTATATVIAAQSGSATLTLAKGTKTVTASFKVSAKSTVTIQVVNSSGKVVRNRLFQKSGVTTGAPIWYEKDDSGKVVPAGTYTFKLTATANGKTTTVSQSVTI
jgi:hypothetical protein